MECNMLKCNGSWAPKERTVLRGCSGGSFCFLMFSGMTLQQVLSPELQLAASELMKLERRVLLAICSPCVRREPPGQREPLPSHRRKPLPAAPAQTPFPPHRHATRLCWNLQVPAEITALCSRFCAWIRLAHRWLSWSSQQAGKDMIKNPRHVVRHAITSEAPHSQN